jgi:hypothetical protein
MKRMTLLTTAAVMLFLCIGALAQKRLVNLGPGNLAQEGFAVATSKRDDGTLDVTITRDVTKARSFDAASELQLVRSATLVVTGPAGTIVRCDLEAQAAAGSVSYECRLAPNYLSQSWITIAEIDDYKNRGDRERLLGGGTFFEIKLADVVKP